MLFIEVKGNLIMLNKHYWAQPVNKVHVCLVFFLFHHLYSMAWVKREKKINKLDLRSVSPLGERSLLPPLPWVLIFQNSSHTASSKQCPICSRQTLPPLSAVAWALTLTPPWAHYSLLEHSVHLSFSLLYCDRLQARLIISLNKYSRVSTCTSQ